MDVKKKLTQLYKEASDYAREAYGKRNHISDCRFGTADDVIEYLIANGVTITPAVPGPEIANPNMMELCFHNGERHMEEKIYREMNRIAKEIPLMTVGEAVSLMQGV